MKPRGDFDGGFTPVIRPSGTCGVTGCGKPTSIALAFGRSPTGANVCVSAGEMVDHAWSLRAGWEHHGWIERCGLHYCEDQMRHRREHIAYHDEPFASVRSVQDFCAFFGVQSVAEALVGTGGQRA